MIGPNDLKDLQKHFTNNEPQTIPIEEEYIVEHLDYTYIRECKDIKQLHKLKGVLESGKEGSFPQLLEFLKNRLQELDPQDNEVVDFTVIYII